MDFAEKLKLYRQTRLEAEALEAEIKAEIEKRKESIETDGISVVYRQGSKSYQYESAGREHADAEIIKKHTTEKVDWKKVCADAGLVNIPFSTGLPSVAIKITDTNPFE